MKEAIMSKRSRYIIFILIIVLIFTGYSYYQQYHTMQIEEVREFVRYQMFLRQLLEDAEGYLINYSIEGMDSELQSKLRKDINQSSAKLSRLFFMNNQYLSYQYLAGIEEIIDELDIYVNHFETEQYPANEENLKYMQNLTALISELLGIVENQKYESVSLDWNWKGEDQIEGIVAPQMQVFDKNTWVIHSSSWNSDEFSELEEIYDAQFSEQLSDEELRQIAYDYLLADMPDLKISEIETDGGGAGYYGTIEVIEFDFEARDVQITLLSNGLIEFIQYIDEGKGIHAASLEENLLKAMAEEYLERHDIEGYVFNSINAPTFSGRAILDYLSANEFQDYESPMESISFRFRNYGEWQLGDVHMPDPINPHLIKIEDKEDAYNQRQRLQGKIEPYFDRIINASLSPRFDRSGRVDYRWIFAVQKDNLTYSLALDCKDGNVLWIHQIFE